MGYKNVCVNCRISLSEAQTTSCLTEIKPALPVKVKCTL